MYILPVCSFPFIVKFQYFLYVFLSSCELKENEIERRDGVYHFRHVFCGMISHGTMLTMMTTLRRRKMDGKLSTQMFFVFHR